MYGHNRDNFLTEITSSNGPTYSFEAVSLDGLGRLKQCNETVTKPDNTTVDQVWAGSYDRRSQLTGGTLYSGLTQNYWEKYVYDKTGNLLRIEPLSDPNVYYGYDGDVLDDYDGSAIGFDLNGQTTNTAAASSVDWNWDGRMRSAVSGTDTISLKYDPLRQRVSREHDDSLTTDKKRYVVANINGLSQILLELDGDDPNIVEKAYVYADDQVLIQYDGDPNFYDTPTYWYVHDRLGSVRMVLDALKNVVHRYTFKPFGETITAQTDAAGGAPTNPFQFTGQYYDEELEQYYLRARQYDPKLARFLSFDPFSGRNQEPLTLHRYLYVLNNPINLYDLTGEAPEGIGDYWNALPDIGFEAWKSLAATIDGLIPVPFFNPFEDVYANIDGSVDAQYYGHRVVGSITFAVLFRQANKKMFDSLVSSGNLGSTINQLSRFDRLVILPIARGAISGMLVSQNLGRGAGLTWGVATSLISIGSISDTANSLNQVGGALGLW